MKSQNQKIKNFIFGIIIISIVFVIIEVIFRLTLPVVYINAGTRRTPKAELYGWAALPDKQEVCIDPDTGEVTYYRVNSQGWRDEERAFTKVPGVTRILFLGDSNTWGSTPLEDNYTRRVEVMLKNRGFRRIEVISMGMGGWGTDQELEALEREGIRYNPDIIIYQFCENDIAENLSPSADTEANSILWSKPFKYELANGKLEKIKLDPKESRLNGAKRLLLKSAVIYNLNEFLKWIEFKIKAYKFTKRSKDNSVSPVSVISRKYPVGGWDLLEALIVRMQQFCRQNNVMFLVFSVQKDTGSLRDICNKHSISFLEPANEYQHYKYNGHPNKIGNLQMSQDIVDFLLNHQPFHEAIDKN